MGGLLQLGRDGAEHGRHRPDREDEPADQMHEHHARRPCPRAPSGRTRAWRWRTPGAAGTPAAGGRRAGSRVAARETEARQRVAERHRAEQGQRRSRSTAMRRPVSSGSRKSPESMRAPVAEAPALRPRARVGPSLGERPDDQAQRAAPRSTKAAATSAASRARRAPPSVRLTAVRRRARTTSAAPIASRYETTPERRGRLRSRRAGRSGSRRRSSASAAPPPRPIMSGIENDASIEEKIRTARHREGRRGHRHEDVAGHAGACPRRAGARPRGSSRRRRGTRRASAAPPGPRCFHASAAAMPAHEDAKPGRYGLQKTRSAWPTTTNGTNSGHLQQELDGPERAHAQPAAERDGRRRR